jgi:hypothetical protein
MWGKEQCLEIWFVVFNIGFRAKAMDDWMFCSNSIEVPMRHP